MKKLTIEVDAQELNRIFEGLDIRRVQIKAGIRGEGNMVPSRSNEDYIALHEKMLVSLESVALKLQEAQPSFPDIDDWNQPPYAWVAVVDESGFSLGLAEEGTKGYSPMKEDQKITFPTYDAASEEAEARNGLLGLSNDDAAKIVFSTMRPVGN